MADAVTTTVLKNEGSTYVVHLTSVSDGTGESAVIKVDKSTLTVSSAEPTSLTLMKANWVTSGMDVRVYWDHTTDDLALVMSGVGSIDFTPYGGKPDPRSSGGTGDILLTTTGHSSGDTYSILLEFRKD